MGVREWVCGLVCRSLRIYASLQRKHEIENGWVGTVVRVVGVWNGRARLSTTFFLCVHVIRFAQSDAESQRTRVESERESEIERQFANSNYNVCECVRVFCTMLVQRMRSSPGPAPKGKSSTLMVSKSYI